MRVMKVYPVQEASPVEETSNFRIWPNRSCCSYEPALVNDRFRAIRATTLRHETSRCSLGLSRPTVAKYDDYATLPNLIRVVCIQPNGYALFC